MYRQTCIFFCKGSCSQAYAISLLLGTKSMLEEMNWHRQLSSNTPLFLIGQRLAALRHTVVVHVVLLNTLVSFGFPFRPRISAELVGGAMAEDLRSALEESSVSGSFIGQEGTAAMGLSAIAIQGSPVHMASSLPDWGATASASVGSLDAAGDNLWILQGCNSILLLLQLLSMLLFVHALYDLSKSSSRLRLATIFQVVTVMAFLYAG